MSGNEGDAAEWHDYRLDCAEGGPVILSRAPSGNLQIDIGTPDGGLVYAEIDVLGAWGLANALIRAAAGWSPGRPQSKG